MVEFVAESIILGRRVLGERDTLVNLFTKDYGIITAQDTSGAKITSKLTPHLQKLSLSIVRIVAKNNYRVADALSEGRAFALTQMPDLSSLQIVYLIRALLPPFAPEPELWNLLNSSNIQHPMLNNILRILGYDPSLAKCAICGNEAQCFAVEDTKFYCKKHAIWQKNGKEKRGLLRFP